MMQFAILVQPCREHSGGRFVGRAVGCALHQEEEDSVDVMSAPVIGRSILNAG
jgi:hypothetical protein